MKRLKPQHHPRRTGLALAILAAALYAAALAGVPGSEPKSGQDAGKEKKAERKTGKPAAGRKLTGAELYALNCNRCHNERYPTEFTAAQWKTIMTHMRVRANLPAEQARAILKYLQEESGTP